MSRRKLGKYEYRKKVAQVSSADGITGFLLRDVGSKFFFRIYGPDHSFADYEIWHMDLQITIDDPSAAFYEVGGQRILDYGSYEYRKKAVQVDSADSIGGFLLRDAGSKFFFRIYGPDHLFTDYKIGHWDLEIIIDDPSAAFYEVGGRRILDYSPAVLGLKKTKMRSR